MKVATTASASWSDKIPSETAETKAADTDAKSVIVWASVMLAFSILTTDGLSNGVKFSVAFVVHVHLLVVAVVCAR